MDRLAELRLFVAIVDCGSFAAAGRRVGRSAPTVTRVVAELESRLGVKLLDRSTRRCSPTEAGAALAQSAKAILEEYDCALSRASGDRIVARGRLRVTAPYLFGREYVAPAILEFLDLHGEISIELDQSDRAVDIQGEGFDLAVRIGRLSEPGLKARRIGFVRNVIVASADYLAQNGNPKTVEDLAGHSVIHHGEVGRRLSALLPLHQWAAGPTGGGRFRVNQADAALAAAKAGRGLVAAISYQVAEDVRAGRLVEVLPGALQDRLPVQLAWPEGRERLLRLRLLIDWLVERLGRLPVLGE